jgi:nonsense-mediated mRNA decay protein 3
MPRSSDYKDRIQENICPRCGGPSPDAGLCGVCRAADLHWLSCDPRVTITLCPVCGSRRETGMWADCSAPRDEVAYDAARRAVHIAPEIQDRVVDLVIREHSANRSIAECRVSGSLFGQQVEGSCQTEIVWEKQQCDRCSRMSGSYYEGIVQVRAVGRKPRPAEISAASRIAREVNAFRSFLIWKRPVTGSTSRSGPSG